MVSQLTQGNAALRAHQYAQAVRHFALGLLDSDSQRHSTLSSSLANNLLLARKRYRQQRRAAGHVQVGISSWSLAENPVGRAYTLATIYQDLAEQQQEGEGGIERVELIGSFFAHRGRELWAPIRDTRIPVHSILIEDDAQFMAQAIDLVSAHPYDLVHLAKPRFPNLLLGLLYQLLWDARVLLDIDDDELAFVRAEQALPLERWLRTYHGLPLWDGLPGRPWTELALSLTHAFDGVSVANRALQQRYGGTILRHARDPQQFQPTAERRARTRADWEIAPAQPVVIFLGTPRRHKGLLETAEALASLHPPRARRQKPSADRAQLSTSGNPTPPLFLIAGRFPASEQPLKRAIEAIRARGKIAIRLLDDQPFAEIPNLLAAADLAVYLQDPDSRAARDQTPAKLSDALAMGLTVLAESTPGLADLAEQGAFIPVTRQSLPAELACALERVSAQHQRPHQPSPSAHPVFTRELSLHANRVRLQELLNAPSQAQPQHQHNLQRLASHPALGPLPRALISAQPSHRRGVSIIILSLDGADLLQRLLHSFSTHNSHQPIELIIVDHSRDPEPQAQTRAVLLRFQPHLPLWLLPRGQNYRFSDSCNLAAGLARYPYLLFLNNDIHYSSDAIPAALQRLADPSIGLVGIRLDDDPESLAPGQSPSVQHLGIEFLWSEQRGYHHPRQIRYPRASERPLVNEPDAASGTLPNTQQGAEHPAVTGAFLLCRKADFDQLGGFSTAYDYGLEDVDLCLRMRRDLNKASWCLTGLALQHAESTTRRRDKALTRERIMRNHQHFKAVWGDHARRLATQPQPITPKATD